MRERERERERERKKEPGEGGGRWELNGTKTKQRAGGSVGWERAQARESWREKLREREEANGRRESSQVTHNN